MGVVLMSERVPVQDKVASVAMRRSIQGMLEELEPNLWEHVLCRLVDYGHTFSPELEMAALTHGDELLHGEAVNIDMALTTQVGIFRCLLSGVVSDWLIKPKLDKCFSSGSSCGAQGAPNLLER